MSKHPKELPYLLVADGDGNVMPHPELKVCGRSAHDLVELAPEDFIALPYGSELYALPGRLAIGYDEGSQDFVPVQEGPGGEAVRPMAAFMAPAYTALYHSAFVAAPDAPKLPLYAYAAVGELEGSYYAAGIRVDPDRRQDQELFDHDLVERKVKARVAAHPENRLIGQLADCALVKQCYAAKNFFLERFEAPLPSAPTCNASCVGCISAQEPEAGFPASHRRIEFVPTVEEIKGCVLPHFAVAEHPVASFGQGCEGEPLSNWQVLEEAIRAIRAETSKGTLNMNSNGSRPGAVRRLREAGLDAIRVSMNSAQKAWYEAYYRPRGYAFEDVRESVKIMAEKGGHASINYFSFPGVSDREAEVEALLKFIKETGLQLIQWRNLNLDPDVYLGMLGDVEAAGESLGVKRMMEIVREAFPKLRFGYFNPAWREEESRRGTENQ